MKNIICLLFAFGLLTHGVLANVYSEGVYLSGSNPYLATDSRYDYMYAQPPRPQAGAYGYYVGVSSNVRYIHSPSRLKGMRHAARINANNSYAYNYGY